jgi:hypothetical protein
MAEKEANFIIGRAMACCENLLPRPQSHSRAAETITPLGKVNKPRVKLYGLSEKVRAFNV